jgi:hypothetical protein
MKIDRQIPSKATYYVYEKGAKSLDKEIDDYLTLTQLIFYAKSRCPRS